MDAALRSSPPGPRPSASPPLPARAGVVAIAATMSQNTVSACASSPHVPARVAMAPIDRTASSSARDDAARCFAVVLSPAGGSIPAAVASVVVGVASVAAAAVAAIASHSLRSALKIGERTRSTEDARTPDGVSAIASVTATSCEETASDADAAEEGSDAAVAMMTRLRRARRRSDAAPPGVARLWTGAVRPRWTAVVVEMMMAGKK